MSEHLARHALEALAIDESAGTPELRAHLVVCQPCSHRLQRIAHARAQHAREHPADAFARRVQQAVATRQRPEATRWQPRWQPRWALLGALLAAAALVYTLRPAQPAIRYRGPSAALQMYVRDESGIRPLHEGEGLAAGTQLAFSYQLTEPQHLLLFGIDDEGTITRYFPDDNLVHSSVLAAGPMRQLPIGIELDARHGRERIIALFSSSALAQTEAHAAIETAWRTARARGRDLREPLEIAVPARQISLWFDKP